MNHRLFQFFRENILLLSPRPLLVRKPSMKTLRELLLFTNIDSGRKQLSFLFLGRVNKVLGYFFIQTRFQKIIQKKWV